MLSTAIEMPLAPVVSAALAAIALFVLTRPKIANGWLDRPNERSLHVRPVPRTGGIGISLGVVIPFLVFLDGDQLIVLLLCMLAGVSLLDDRRGLHPALRFAAHFVAAAIFVWRFLPDHPSWVWLCAVMATTWMTNLYNFMDGSDGLAGAMGLIGFGTYGFVSWIQGDQSIATMSGCIAAASLAFLVFNFHPAKIFLGDVGSIPLGFLAASIGFLGWHRGVWPIWFPAVVFSPFVIDATVTLARRLLRGEKIWQAHREHYYQRLVMMGWGHLKTFYAEAALMLCASLAAVVAVLLPAPASVLILLGLAAIFVVGAVWIDLRWAQSKQKS